MASYFILVIVLSLLDVAGASAAKMWYLHKSPYYLALTIILFGLAGLTFAKSLSYQGMAITNILWVAFSAILVVLVGYFIFRENITPLQLVGIVIIIGGLVLVNYQ